LVLGGIAMTYFALAFLVEERRRQIDADYQSALRADSLRVQLGHALVAVGARLLDNRVTFDEPEYD